MDKIFDTTELEKEIEEEYTFPSAINKSKDLYSKVSVLGIVKEEREHLAKEVEKIFTSDILSLDDKELIEDFSSQKKFYKIYELIFNRQKQKLGMGK